MAGMPIRRAVSNAKLLSGVRPNTIGMNEHGLVRLLDRLDEGGGSDRSEAAKRRFTRQTFRQVTVCIAVIHASGQEVTLKVACRNLSAGGMSILHSAYMHTGCKCRVVLPRANGAGSPVVVTGTVVRCQHRIGMVHEIGIRFDTQIDPKAFIPTDPYGSVQTLEHIDPADLKGEVLAVLPQEFDQQVIRHYLRETQCKLRVVATLDEVAQGETTPDVILSDTAALTPDTDQSSKTLAWLTSQAPFLVIAPDAGAESRNVAAYVSAKSLLVRPLSQIATLRAIGEILLMKCNP